MKSVSNKILKYSFLLLVLIAIFLYPRLIKTNNLNFVSILLAITKKINKILGLINPHFRLTERKIRNYLFFLLYFFLGLLTNSIIKFKLGQKFVCFSQSLMICVFVLLTNEFILELNSILIFSGAGMALFLILGSTVGIYFNSLFGLKSKSSKGKK
ncbi:MAG: hypothetical protein CfP315_0660 [Candidatus Improbicoccus pseudotrichonymphae]|uniref:Uncharacterized protein n=1 Tax=Candidatus Improbicoccus pseudotrichonymphae TaxID=3033792 RepID=A0AA48I8K4_9FIRM|nr:MAG: hypothetical protein CfP315_0660 [Candidatus Improbicoccus pseudotrichonymphae]